MADRKTFQVDDATIIFRNFSGRESQYNNAGDRNFAVVLPDADVAKAMKEDGWNVRWSEPREEGDEPVPTVQVTVNFKNIPPRITMITSKNSTLITEDTVGMLDGVDIARCDLIANGSDWTVNGKSGVKAYLKTMFLTINEDALELRYSYLDNDDPEDGDHDD